MQQGQDDFLMAFNMFISDDLIKFNLDSSGIKVPNPHTVVQVLCTVAGEASWI